MNALRVTVAGIFFALTAGCATVPPGPPADVVRLQAELDRLHQDPRIAPNAVDELRDADAAVAVLAGNSRRMEAPVYGHRVYVADRLLKIAEAQGLARFAETRSTALGIERERLTLAVRDRELRDAQLRAENAEAAAANERRNAQITRGEAAGARDEMAALRTDLGALQARQTQRGLVVTLGDFLFEDGRAGLKPGAERTRDGLVRALRDDPGASMQIDGHTDPVGGRSSDLDLSLRRAESVKTYLANRGIAPARLTARGLGAGYPVASNATEAGRRQNRRVEVVVQTQVAALGRRPAARDR